MSKSSATGDEVELTPEQRAEQYKRLRRSLDAKYMVADERWNAKAAVLATVTERGPMKWAHEIVALAEAGLYPSPTGLEMAKKAIAERVVVV